MDLIEFLRHFFDRRLWDRVEDKDKKKWFFQVLNYLSVKYPLEIQKYNNKDMNQIDFMNFWHIIITSKFKAGNFNWMFPSEAKKEKDICKKDTKDKLMKMYQLDERDFNFLQVNFKEQLIEEIKDLEKIEKSWK
jgi:hypothetical protein